MTAPPRLLEETELLTADAVQVLVVGELRVCRTDGAPVTETDLRQLAEGLRRILPEDTES